MPPVPQLIAPLTAFGRFRRSKYFWAFGVTLAGNAATAIKELVNWRKSTSNDVLLTSGFASVVGLAVIVGIINLIKLWKEFNTEHVDGPEFALNAVVFTAVNGLKATAKKGGDPKLRMCVHVLHPLKNEWIQKTNYAGNGGGQGKGRKQAVSKGVVGAALRSGQIVNSKVKKSQKRVDLLIEQGYTSAEVSEMRGDTLSWIALPIAHPDHPSSPFAVLYGDCVDPCFFDANFQVRRKILEACVLGIAEFCNPKRA